MEELLWFWLALNGCRREREREREKERERERESLNWPNDKTVCTNLFGPVKASVKSHVSIEGLVVLE